MTSPSSQSHRPQLQQARSKSLRNLFGDNNRYDDMSSEEPSKPSSLLSFVSPRMPGRKRPTAATTASKQRAKSKSFTSGVNLLLASAAGGGGGGGGGRNQEDNHLQDSPTGHTLPVGSESSHYNSRHRPNNVLLQASAEFPDLSINSFASASPTDSIYSSSGGGGNGNGGTSAKSKKKKAASFVAVSSNSPSRTGTCSSVVGVPPLHPQQQQPSSSNSLLLQEENEKLQKEIKRLKRHLKRKSKQQLAEEESAAASQTSSQPPATALPFVGVTETNNNCNSNGDNTNTIEFYENFISEMEKTIRELTKANIEQKQRITYLESKCSENGIDVTDSNDVGTNDDNVAVVEQQDNEDDDAAMDGGNSSKLGDVLQKIERLHEAETNKKKVQGKDDGVDDDAVSNISPKPVHNCFKISTHSQTSKGSRRSNRSGSNRGGGGFGGASTSSSGGDEGSFTAYDDIWEEDLVQEEETNVDVDGDEQQEQPSSRANAPTRGGSTATRAAKPRSKNNGGGGGSLSGFLDENAAHDSTTTGLSSRMTSGEASFADDASIDLSLGDVLLLSASGRNEFTHDDGDGGKNPKQKQKNMNKRNKRQSLTIHQISSTSTSLTNPGYSVSSGNSWFNLTCENFMKSSINHNSTSMAGDLAFMPHGVGGGTSPLMSDKKGNKKHGSKEDLLTTVMEDKSSHNPTTLSNHYSNNRGFHTYDETKELRRGRGMRRLQVPVSEATSFSAPSKDRRVQDHVNGSLLATLTRSLSNKKLQVN